MSGKFEISQLNQELARQLSSRCASWEKPHRERLGWGFSIAVTLACERAAKHALKGQSVPSSPTAAQLQRGLSESLYRELYPLLISGLEESLQEMVLAFRPTLERYSPGCLSEWRSE